MLANSQRLFFALWPDASLAAALYSLSGSMLGAGHGRRIASTNLHMTLVFLGSVTAEQRAGYEQAATRVQGRAFRLTLDCIGCFQRAGILWAGSAQAPSPLLSLVHDLNAALAAHGFVAEKREYRAHFTLARDVRRCPLERAMEPIEWPVRQFALVQSHTESSGAQYVILRTWNLN